MSINMLRGVRCKTLISFAKKNNYFTKQNALHSMPKNRTMLIIKVVYLYYVYTGLSDMVIFKCT